MLIVALHTHMLQKCGAHVVEFVKNNHFDDIICSANDMMALLMGNVKQKRSNTASF